jgi:hypothetical protein
VSALRQARRVTINSRASAALVHPTIPPPSAYGGSAWLQAHPPSLRFLFVTRQTRKKKTKPPTDLATALYAPHVRVCSFLMLLSLVRVLVPLSLSAATPTPTNSTPQLRGGCPAAASQPAAEGMLRSIGSLLSQSWRASWRAAAVEDEDNAVMQDAYGLSKGGSGAINEKTLVGATKASELAPLLHATFGLDHYPNYLQRWYQIPCHCQCTVSSQFLCSVGIQCLYASCCPTRVSYSHSPASAYGEKE